MKVKFQRLPFFKTREELIKPVKLVPTRYSWDYGVQKFYFRLTRNEVSTIRQSCYQVNGENNYKLKVLVRFGRDIVDWTQVDTFPPGLRIYVNDLRIKNLNSLKPENYQSEHHDWPLDITPYLKLKRQTSNKIRIKWKPSTSKFAVGVYLVKTRSSDDLFDKLLACRFRSASYTLRKIKKMFEEENGIVPTTLPISLICPLSKKRIVTPCQSSICNHLQCFDAEAFLQLNEKSHTWKCPICDSLAEFDHLVIDDYFDEILASNRLTDDDIHLFPDGSWENSSYWKTTDLNSTILKARLARIRIAKASSGAAFVSKKKAAEARIAALESGLQTDEIWKEEDIFELQHHHLLRCLEKTTDREFVEMDVPFNGAPKRPGSPSPLTSPAHSTASRGGLLQSCCGRCYPQRYQVRGRGILVSRTSISDQGPPSLSSQSQSQSHSHPSHSTRYADPTAVPSVAFNIPGDADRRRYNSGAPDSPYNETRV